MMELNKQAIVARANEVHDELGSLSSDEATWLHVKSLVDQPDVVIGVWQDAEAPDGVGTYIIKGDRLLRRLVADSRGSPFRSQRSPLNASSKPSH